MEKVTDLFKAFRNNEIAYEELFGSLTRMLSEDPGFAAQAISILDNAQQLTPIPVTDFIQLRSQLENTAATFQQQSASATPADAEATRIFDAAEATRRPEPGLAGSGDPTLVSAPPPEAEFQPLPGNAAQDPHVADYQDEATVIMPVPPRQQTPPPPQEPAPAAAPPVEDEHATLIATPAPEPAPSPEPAPAAVRESAPDPAVKPKQQDKKPPVMLLAGAGGVALVLILALVLWPSGEEEPGTAATPPLQQEPASPWQSRPQATQPSTAADNTETAVFSEPDQPAANTAGDPFTSLNDTAADSDPVEQTTTDPEEDSGEFFAADNSLPLDTGPEPHQPPEPAVKDEAYYMAQIEAAVAADKLTPAEQQGTATHYLVELIRLNRNSEKISEARTLISKRHLELAKAAREKSQWDAAQQHLDDALKVRLPDSYLP